MALRLAALIVGAVLLAPAAMAVGPTNIYQVTVPLEGAGTEARQAAFEAALAQVLVRMTGDRFVAGDERALPLLAQAARYVQQFALAEDNALDVTFDRRSLEQALAGAGLPVWGAERPVTLVWLAMDHGEGRRAILPAQDDVGSPLFDPLREVLEAAAELRGLRLVLPLMDAEDQQRISFTDIAGGFDEPVRLASERYDVDAVLVGLYRAWEPDRMRWLLLDEGVGLRWSGTVEAGPQQLGDLYARRYAVADSASEAGLLALSVAGVRDMPGYGRVTRYLEGLTSVRELRVESLSGDTVLFKVRLRGSLDALDEAIRLGGILERDTEPPPLEVPGLSPRQPNVRPPPAEGPDTLGPDGVIDAGPLPTRFNPPVTARYRLRP